MRSVLNILLTSYLMGVAFGLMVMVIGQRLYSRNIYYAKIDWWWMFKIALLSWISVYLGMILINDSLKRNIKLRNKTSSEKN